MSLFKAVFDKCGKPVTEEDGVVSILAMELDKDGKAVSEKVIDASSVILERGIKDKVCTSFSRITRVDLD